MPPFPLWHGLKDVSSFICPPSDDTPLLKHHVAAGLICSAHLSAGQRKCGRCLLPRLLLDTCCLLFCSAVQCSVPSDNAYGTSFVFPVPRLVHLLSALARSLASASTFPSPPFPLSCT